MFWVGTCGLLKVTVKLTRGPYWTFARTGHSVMLLAMLLGAIVRMVGQVTCATMTSTSVHHTHAMAAPHAPMVCRHIPAIARLVGQASTAMSTTTSAPAARA